VSVLCQSQSHFTADSQPVSMSWTELTSGRLTRYCFLLKSLGLEFVVLSLLGAFSDERLCLSFVRVRVTLRLTVSQSVCLGVELTSGRLTRYCFIFKNLGLEYVVLSLWGALSDVGVRVTLRQSVSQ
jgi:hypothetical protein